jgi:hypothetical protein
MVLQLTKLNLDNLVKTGQLKQEPCDQEEIGRMLEIAHRRLLDSRIQEISIEGRFTSAYNSAHGAALAALRWHGYRSENRFLVFQCLSDTLAWPTNKWRVFDLAHQKRNLAEYEGYIEIEESTIKELRDLTSSLIKDVERLVKTK